MKFRLLSILALTSLVGLAQTPYPGTDAVHGVTQVSGLVDVYTGNVAFSTQDIVVAGAVGQHGLSWRRHATSRTSQTEKLFGGGHNWSHNWQWEMAETGKDADGHLMIVVREPQGWIHQFTETSPGEWQPAPGVMDRVVSSGDDFTVQRFDAGEVRFTRTKYGFTLDRIVDDSGNAWTFGWEKGRLIQITEPAGRWLKVSYGILSPTSTSKEATQFTMITHVAASDGQAVDYHYEFLPGTDYPTLTSVVYPDKTVAHYTYAAPRVADRFLLVQAVDPRAEPAIRGRIFHYRTEPEAAAGQLLEITTSRGEVIQSLAADVRGGDRDYATKQSNGATKYLKYSPGGNLVEEVDALGFSKKHEYDLGGRGFKTATTDALGRVFRFENDSRGNLTKYVFPDGSFKTWQLDDRGRIIADTDELGRTRHFTRDTRGRVTRIQNVDNATEEMTYNDFGQLTGRKDSIGAVWTMIYDPRGLLSKAINPLGGTVVYAYDGQDRLASATDAGGNTTRYERDAAGRITKTTYADGVSESVEYDAFGNVTRTTDASGAVRRMTYDEFGRLVSTIDPLGNETSSVYANIGEIAPFDRPVRAISASGRITAMSYNMADCLISVTTAAGTSEAATTRFAYDAIGQQIGVTDPLGNTTQSFYDKRGRRIKTMTALDHAATTVFDPTDRRISTTDANGNTTRWTYDSMGRELTKTDAKGEVTRREYDAAGRLVTLIDAKLNTYRFEYDLLGRQTGLVYPDGSRETTIYNGVGLKIRFTNRAGSVQTFTYDNRNREIVSEWNDGSQKIIKAYDAAGRLTLEDNSVSKLTYAYDLTGEVISETQDISPIVTGGISDPAPRTVSYAYNSEGQRVKLNYPDGSIVRYTYNAQGRLQDIVGDSVAQPIAKYIYDRAGNATSMPRENDTETASEFDAENKTLSISEHVVGRHGPLSSVDYLYDQVGNRTASMTAVDDDGQGPKKETIDVYNHDETYQVTGADYAAPVVGNNVGVPLAKERFTYDAVGNRMQVDENGSITRYAVNNLNQYTQVGEFAATSDRNGNLSSMGQWVYNYDALNRLVLASNGSATVKFFYDAKNRCVARICQVPTSRLSTLSATLTLNTYDNWNLLDERDQAGMQIARYVQGPRMDEIVAMVNRHGTYYPHRDVLGNVTMITDGVGRLVERYTYSVSGQVIISDPTGTRLAESAIDNRWMFAGREWLKDVKLYDYRNRVYSAELGRFLQTDPIRFNAGDVDIYRYVSNNFCDATDPYGLGEVKVFMYNDGNGFAHAFTKGTYNNSTTYTIGAYPNGNSQSGSMGDAQLISKAGTRVLATYSNVDDYTVGQVQYNIGVQNGQYSITNHCGYISDNAISGAGITLTTHAATQVEYATAQNYWNQFTSWIIGSVKSFFGIE